MVRAQRWRPWVQIFILAMTKLLTMLPTQKATMEPATMRQVLPNTMFKPCCNCSL